MIGKRLEEFLEQQEQGELAQQEMAQRSKLFRYQQSMYRLLEELGKHEVLFDLGLNTSDWLAKVSGTTVAPYGNSIDAYFDTELSGHKIHTEIRWGDSLEPTPSNGYSFTLSWLDGRGVYVGRRVYNIAEWLKSDLFLCLKELLEDIEHKLADRRREAERNVGRLAAAAEFMWIAKAYKEKLAVYEKAESEWSKTEQARLWFPWKVYEIKVLPFVVSVAQPVPAEPDVLFVLESPSQIAHALATAKMFTADVTEVDHWGKTRKVAICGLYYGKEIAFDQPEPRFHVRYSSKSPHDEGETVFVPAIVNVVLPLVPAPAPEWVGYWRDECDRLVSSASVDASAFDFMDDAYRIAVRRGVNEIAALEKPEDFYSN